MVGGTQCKAFTPYEPFIQVLHGGHIEHAATDGIEYPLGDDELPYSPGERGGHQRKGKDHQTKKGTQASAVRKSLAGANDNGRQEVHETLQQESDS